MKSYISFPSKQEGILAAVITAIFVILTYIFVEFRPEHVGIILPILTLFFVNIKSRKLIVGLLPWVIFAASYDWMRVYPNYMVNPIDIEGIYNLEKEWFGVNTETGRLIWSEYFAYHYSFVVDFFAGIFYLGWVPIPIAFALYRYFKKDYDIFLRFSIVFLLVNLIGFIGYYVRPAAPPWYVMNYGFEAIIDTPGNVAGLGRFDKLVGIPIFSNLYERNSNVFAAIPSLHSAYLVVVLYYAIVKKCHPALIAFVAIFLLGIWFTAVYSAHHYIIDVILGALCAVFGIILFEKGFMKIPKFKSFLSKYVNYIKQ